MDEDRGDIRGESSVVLLSGGLDSTVAWAMERGDKHALFVNYGQFNRRREEFAAFVLTNDNPAKLHVADIRWPFKAGLLCAVPQDRTFGQMATGIAPTYLAGRNTVFLSLAWGLAQTLGATKIVIGANRHDHDG